MSNTVTYSLKLPPLGNFEMKYYYRKTPEKSDARVFPPHVHDVLEAYVHIDGNASFMVENKIYALSSGDIVVSKPNEIHHCILNSASTHKHLCFWFSDALSALYPELFSQKSETNSLIVPENSVKEKLLDCYEELENASVLNEERAEFYTALKILDLWCKSTGKPSQAQSSPRILRDILNDINENFTEINSLDYFTEKYFISSSTLNRLFQTHLQTSPKLYLETKRLAYSRTLLKEGASVFDACMKSGFPDYSNYIRLFKKRFLMTPKQYRDR